MKHMMYRMIILCLLISFFRVELLTVFGIKNFEHTEEYITEGYSYVRESSEFWSNLVTQTGNISVIKNNADGINSGSFMWERLGENDTTLHFVFGYSVDKFSKITLHSDTDLGFRLHHYLYKNKSNCESNILSEVGSGDIHDRVRIDKIRNSIDTKLFLKDTVATTGFGGNCFLQGEILPLGYNDYSGNNNYQLSLPEISGFDKSYTIYTIYSIYHDLDKENYTINWSLEKLH